ncbi:SufS family cysteine desulfurase [Candidatus Peregrinibacteria bacterium]|nr:SufS family cysteine desulfurase [Candidatus Peregrinibacteria bacterium]
MIPEEIINQFPILKRKINGQPLAYLDNASTTQKPKSVIRTLKNYYETSNANIHRGIHTLSEESTSAYEKTRETAAKFINANSEKEIIFTRNTTEAINLIAYTWGETNIKENDEIIVSELEHHSNLIPWQQLAKRKKAQIKAVPVKKDYTLDMEAYKKLLSEKTRIVAVSAMSNVLGTIPPIKEIITLAHNKNALVLIDGAQSAGHGPTNVQYLDADFFTFSSHKMLGPTGIGVLFAKESILKKIPPFLFGGEMAENVDQYNAGFTDIPWKFEAGTPNIADTIAFNEALEFLSKIGLENIEKHDRKLIYHAKEKFSKHENVKLYIPENLHETGPVLSFTIEGIHPHDIATVFDDEGVAIRSGHHCAQPLMKKLGIQATARMSFYLYNTIKDIEQAEKALQKTLKLFK